MRALITPIPPFRIALYRRHTPPTEQFANVFSWMLKGTHEKEKSGKILFSVVTQQWADFVRQL